jgi:hypothetical protein
MGSGGAALFVDDTGDLHMSQLKLFVFFYCNGVDFRDTILVQEYSEQGARDLYDNKVLKCFRTLESNTIHCLDSLRRNYPLHTIGRYRLCVTFEINPNQYEAIVPFDFEALKANEDHYPLTAENS